MTDDNDKPTPKPYIDPGSLIDFSYFDRMSDQDFTAWFIGWVKGGGWISYCWGKDIIVSKIVPPYQKETKR